MFVQIGRRQPPEDLVTLFLECHGRIRFFSSIAAELGRRDDVPPAEVLDACDRCSRYFTEALPLHVADEELSLLPRLRGQREDVDAALDLMHSQHAGHGPLLDELLAALKARRTSPGEAGPREQLATVAKALQQEFSHHLELEERVLFPAVPALLGPDQQRAVLGELRARRH